MKLKFAFLNLFLGCISLLLINTKFTSNVKGDELQKVELNNEIKKAASFGKLVNQIHYSINNELVSSDIIGNSCCAVFDSHATTVSKSGKEIVIYVWYDNEYGYSNKLLDLSKYIYSI